ncbi:MAG: hypothetical protein HZA93_23415 [Verrucomicrobia bacterium]|nr:hypothetical protein [Verrucomicrobiota bacterium]
MPASSINVLMAPPPAVARPVRWPPALAGAAAVLLVVAGKFAGAAWLGGGTLLATFFLGHRLGGRWAGVALAVLVPVGWIGWPPGLDLAAELFLGVFGAWALVRFADDPAPFNGIVAGIALGTLTMLHRFGAVGVVVAAGVLSIRFRPLWRVWPWIAGAALGWWLARQAAWF